MQFSLYGPSSSSRAKIENTSGNEKQPSHIQYTPSKLHIYIYKYILDSINPFCTRGFFLVIRSPDESSECRWPISTNMRSVETHVYARQKHNQKKKSMFLSPNSRKKIENFKLIKIWMKRVLVKKKKKYILLFFIRVDVVERKMSFSMKF